jgi:hypothetical protein
MHVQIGVDGRFTFNADAVVHITVKRSTQRRVVAEEDELVRGQPKHIRAVIPYGIGKQRKFYRCN